LNEPFKEAALLKEVGLEVIGSAIILPLLLEFLYLPAFIR
jgi:hypothetical protein